MKDYRQIPYIVFPTHGSFCAYVRLPDNHPYVSKIHYEKSKLFDREHEIGYDDMDIKCHGGLTFSSIIGPADAVLYPQGFTPGAWIGWDYLHAFDFVDFKIPGARPMGGRKYSEAEIEADCMAVIDQVLNSMPVQP